MLQATKSILKKVYAHGRGWVFTSSDFVDLESLSVVGKVLTRLTNKGTIRRIARGLYYFPKHSDFLGELSPSYDYVAKAIARKYSLRLQYTGAHAANYLGLSLQVPAKIVFLTDGSSRTVTVGNQRMIFKKTSLKYMGASQIGGLVIQALRFTGKDYVDDKVIRKLQRQLSYKHKKQLLRDIVCAPAWISDIIRKIVRCEGVK